MKKTNKDKLKKKREDAKKREIYEQELIDNQIVNTISGEQISKIRNFNINTFSDKEITRSEMMDCLQNLMEIVTNSSYLDEVVRMTKQNVSKTWFDKEVNEEFVREVLSEELNNSKETSTEGISLKVCFWANRIAHHIENEVMGKQKKHKMNEIYIKYFLNPKYSKELITNDELSDKKISDEGKKGLEKILIQESTSLGDIDDVDKLNNLFLGLNVRNELWTLKQQMLKTILLDISQKDNPTVKVTAIDETKKLTIFGSETTRLIIREFNSIAPVIIHCDKGSIDDFLTQNNLDNIDKETSEEIIGFAKDRKSWNPLCDG